MGKPKAIGPRMANGKFTMLKKPRTAKATKAFKQKVLAVMESKAENKYISLVNNVATGVLDTVLTGAPTQLVQCIPKLGQGTQSNQRVGQKISNAKGRVDFSIFLIPSGTNYPTQDIYVRIFMLTSKSAKSYGQVYLLPGGTLLDNGDQTTSDWGAGTGGNSYGLVNNQKPFSAEDWRVLAQKKVRLTKNQGTPNGDTSPGQAPNTFGRVAANVSMAWKHQGSILYDDVAGAGPANPTNYAPVYGIVAFNSDNTPYSGLVQYTSTLHMWYEDY